MINEKQQHNERRLTEPQHNTGLKPSILQLDSIITINVFNFSFSPGNM